MAVAKTNGFRWLPSYYEAIRDLPDQERLGIYDAILDFGFGNQPDELPPMEQAIFCLIKPTLETSIKFEKKQRENGQKGGRPPKTQTKPKEIQTGFGKNLDIDVDNDVDVEDETGKPAVCSESHGGSEPPVITLPLNDKSEYPISKEQCQEWAGLYPAVDVIQQLRNMLGWLNSNPGRRKTKSGIKRFVTSWLSKEQDKYHPAAAGQGQQRGNGATFMDMWRDEYGGGQ